MCEHGWMSEPPNTEAPPDLGARLEALGRALGSREAEHADAFEVARDRIERLHAQVAGAVERFHAAARAAGAPHLRVELTGIRVDDKHLRALEFDLVRGHHKAVVTAKSRGDITLVGPFRVGKAEGPCRSFAAAAEQELGSALVAFLGNFLEEAAAP
jgi:hypothetical protein